MFFRNNILSIVFMNKYKKKFGEWMYSNGDRNKIIDKIGLILVITYTIMCGLVVVLDKIFK